MSEPVFFFDTWMSLLRTAVVGVLAYLLLVFVLRISGKRTLSKMNAFDLVVTVALGSTLATTFLSKDVALADGMLALTLLVALQWVLTFASSRSTLATKLVKSEPRLIAFQGQLLEDALKRERIIEDEVLAAVRSQGIGRLDEVEAVVLETDGSITVLPKEERPATVLESVQPVGTPSQHDRAASGSH